MLCSFYQSRSLLGDNVPQKDDLRYHYTAYYALGVTCCHKSITCPVQQAASSLHIGATSIHSLLRRTQGEFLYSRWLSLQAKHELAGMLSATRSTVYNM